MVPATALPAAPSARPLSPAGALLRHDAPPREEIDVIPPVGAEWIHDQWRPQREAHLGARHARLQPGNHLVRDDIALLDVHLVGPDEARASASGRHQRDNDDRVK
jgi:hypothetical protein